MDLEEFWSQYLFIYLFVFERNEYLIEQGHIKWIKSDSKDIMLQKTSISNKCCSFELSRLLK